MSTHDQLKDELGRYFPEVRSRILEEVQQVGFWAAVEGSGVPFSTVQSWVQKEKKAALKELSHQGLPSDCEALRSCPGSEESSPGEAVDGWRIHSLEEKAAALKDWETLGTKATAVKYGVVPQTIRNWRYTSLQEGLPTAVTGPNATAGPSTEVSTEPRIENVGAEQWEKLSQPKKGVAKRYTASQRAGILGDIEKVGVSAAARKSGASRHSVYRWLRRARREAGLPVTRRWQRSDVEKQRDLEILHEWHKQPGLGPMQIRSQLRRRGVRTSVHTVRRVMEDAGYRPPKVQSHSHRERYEAVRPNQLWHLDFVHRHINRAGTFTLILLDDHSRYVVGHAVGDAERSDLVVSTFESAVTRHGRPEAVMTDRGSAFWAWRGMGRFTRLLEEMGVDQIVAKDKELNGKVEVFNANLAKELFDAQRFDDVLQMKDALDRHLDWYNHRRTHQALGGLLVPADRYYGRAEEVTRLLESGETRDLHDPELEARALTMLQVVRREGHPEVWLLGQRIL